MKFYILSRLQETSTWRGLLLVLGSAGSFLAPQYADILIPASVLLAGSIGVVTPDQAAKILDAYQESKTR